MASSTTIEMESVRAKSVKKQQHRKNYETNVMAALLDFAETLDPIAANCNGKNCGNRGDEYNWREQYEVRDQSELLLAVIVNPSMLCLKLFCRRILCKLLWKT